MYISVIYHCRILARTLSFMLEPRFDLAWKEDLSDDSRALMARRFMEVTETLGVLMMAGQPDWRHTDVGVVVVVTPNICKYLLSTILSLDLPPCPLPVLKPSVSSIFSLEAAYSLRKKPQKRLCSFTTTVTKRFMLLRPHLQLRKVVYHWALKVLAGTILRLSPLAAHSFSFVLFF